MYCIVPSGDEGLVVKSLLLALDGRHDNYDYCYHIRGTVPISFLERESFVLNIHVYQACFVAMSNLFNSGQLHRYNLQLIYQNDHHLNAMR